MVFNHKVMKKKIFNIKNVWEMFPWDVDKKQQQYIHLVCAHDVRLWPLVERNGKVGCFSKNKKCLGLPRGGKGP